MGQDLDFSRIIRNERRRMDITQQQLGQRVGVSDSYIAHIESGLKVPSLDVSMALANVFGFNVQQQQALLDALESSRVTRSTRRIRTRGLAVRGALRTLGRRGEGRIRLTDTEDGGEHETLATSGLEVQLLRLSPDGRWIAGADDRGQIMLWDVAREDLVANLGGDAGSVTALEFVPGRDRLLAASGGPAIAVWDTKSGAQLEPIESGLDEIMALAASADGKMFAAGDASGWVALHEVGRNEPPQTLELHEGDVVHLAFAPDGTLLASGGSDGTVRLLQVDTGSITHTLEHESSVVCVCFSADGDLLASATANRVTQWDAGSGKSLLVVDTTGHEPLALAFRSDGLTLVSASADGSITSWDTRKGTVRNTLALEGAPFDVLAISADARRIAIFEPKGQAEQDEYDPRQIARDLAADRDLMDAFRHLKTAMANPGLRHTVMTTLRALARSTDE